MAIETEIRTLLPTHVDAVTHLMSSGYTHVSDVVQLDVMHDLPGGDLFKSGRKIRIRIEGENASLTFKGEFQDLTGISKREEIDIEFNKQDAENLGRILTSLGYPMLFQIQKRRITLKRNGISATVDEWPIIGAMLEFEGSEEAIQRAAAAEFPDLEFGNPRLKALFEDRCKSTGKTIEQLKHEYQVSTGFDLGNIEFLVG